MNKYEKYLKQKNTFHRGDIVLWEYEHHLNSKSSVIRTKKGKFIRRIKSVKRDGGCIRDYYKYCLVHFRGNKNPSRILISEIKKV